VKFVTICWSFEHFLKGVFGESEKDLNLVRGLNSFVVFCFVVG
jgi:hypothetical protein